MNANYKDYGFASGRCSSTSWKNFGVPLFPEQDFYKAETNYQNYRGSSHLKIEMDGNTYASLPGIDVKNQALSMVRFSTIKTVIYFLQHLAYMKQY
jgi:hypothetical protein